VLNSEVSSECKKHSRQRGRLVLEIDEMWSFVNSKSHKVWIWLALDSLTKEIVGVYVGDRDRSAARQLWDSLPPVYRQCAICYTDCRFPA
jgi:IS1 family transposase